MQAPPGCLHCPVRLTTPLNGYVPMSVIWVSCHIGANAVKCPHLKIEALRYGCCVSCKGYVKFRSRRLFATTKTDEKAIAAPAIIGFSSPAAAGGSAATL